MTLSEIFAGACTLLVGIVGFFMRQQLKSLETVSAALHQHSIEDAKIQSTLAEGVRNIGDRFEFLQTAVLDVLHKEASGRK